MNKKMSIVLKGIINENPVFVLVLGTCPALAQTSKVITALGMGLAATFVLICSNVAVSLLRKVIVSTVRIPCYIVVIAGFVTIAQLFIKAFLPSLYDMMGVYLALIVVNCIILGRAEMYASKNSVFNSFLDGIGMGIGFLFALLAMATIREVLGSGSFAGIEIPFVKKYSIPFLNQAAGGFMVFGVMIAIMNASGFSAGGKRRKNFSCKSCSLLNCCGCSESSKEESTKEYKAMSEGDKKI